MNPLYTEEEIAHQLKDATAQHIITIPLFAEKAKQSASKVGIETVFVVGEADGCEPFSVLLQDDGEEFPEDVQFDPKDDIACLAYSSGTTGAPKGVMLTHFNLIADASIALHERFYLLNENPVVLGLLPFFHAFGQMTSLSCALLKGATVVCVSCWSQFCILTDSTKKNWVQKVFLLFILPDSSLRGLFAKKCSRMICFVWHSRFAWQYLI